MAGGREALELACGTRGTAAVTVGATAGTGVALAIDVAGGSVALEAAIAAFAARTAAVGANAVALVIVSNAIDVARRGVAMEVAGFAPMAPALAAVAATVVVVVAATDVQHRRNAEQKQRERGEGKSGPRKHGGGEWHGRALRPRGIERRMGAARMMQTRALTFSFARLGVF